MVTKGDITELKSLSAPPQDVKNVMESMCILFGLNPDWKDAKKLLSNPNLLKNMKEFDSSKVSEETKDRIRKEYISKDYFRPEEMAKKSHATKKICQWVIDECK